ncbi:MAG: glyoxalase [Euryarchaeota archaeon RBG_16_62_10]|nr:MAG: glyoxalase [Euryarchaeota archaeon RBG_16_62_10]
MPRVIHFEVDADYPERAMKFYTAVFRWKADKWEGSMDYWLVTTGEKDEPWINGAIMKRAEPSPSVCNTVGVASVDETTKTVLANGGSVLMEKSAVPGVGWFAYLKDAEGNIFGVTQADMNVK